MWSENEYDVWDDAEHGKSIKKKQKTIKQLDEKGLRQKAIELLARREYSLYELEKKLVPLALEEMQAYDVLDWLTEHGLQSDTRFCETYVRSKSASGYGPIRIKQELKQKGIQTNLVDDCFEAQEINWHEKLDSLVDKKLNGIEKSDLKSKQKCMGFLQRRGFSLDQIYSALNRYGY